MDTNKIRVPYKYSRFIPNVSREEIKSLFNAVNIYHGIEPEIYDKYYQDLIILASECGENRVINFNLVELINILRFRSEEFDRNSLSSYFFIGIEDFTFQDIEKLDFYDRKVFESFIRRNLEIIKFSFCLTEYETEQKTIFEKMIRKKAVLI